MAKPKIRFNGYTEDWEQRKFGSLLEETRNKTIFEDEDTLLSCAIDGMYLNSELFSHFRGSSNIGYLKVKKNDLILSAQNLHLGNCNVNLRFEHGIISPAYKVYELVGCNPLFMQAWVKKDSTKDFFLKSSTEGASVCRKNIVWEELYKQELPVPSIEEQTKVGEYFSNLDHLITLHQRKCEQTKTLKKYMLQKMFPQDGEKVPQIRFEGFTEDWEQRKLGDLVDRVTRKNQDLVSELPLTISAQYGLIDQNEFFDKRVASKDVSGYYLIENGEFAYNKSTSTDAPWGAIKRLDRYENGVLSTLYIIFGIKENNPVDSDFLVSYYSTNLWHKGIHEIAAEGARNHGLLNIAPADFFATRLMIPQDIEEQKKIGKYFIELEALITLHQRKCDELKEVKKFMLQNMFV